MTNNASTLGIKTVLHPVSDLDDGQGGVHRPARRAAADRRRPTTSASTSRASTSGWCRAVDRRA